MFKLVLSLSIKENNVFVATEETGYLVSEQHFICDRPVELQWGVFTEICLQHLVYQALHLSQLGTQVPVEQSLITYEQHSKLPLFTHLLLLVSESKEVWHKLFVFTKIRM